jgi:hypothetical protein
VSKRKVRNSRGEEHELSGDELKVWDALRWGFARQIAEQTGIPVEDAEKTISELREMGLGAIVFDEEKDEFRLGLTELGKLVAKREFGATPE